MLSQESLETLLLTDELREFAEEMPVIVATPTMDAVTTAVKSQFPELTNQSLSQTELMDAIGLSAVVRLGADLFISWSAADNDRDATEQVERFSQSTYSQIRKSLGIQHHWVIKVQPDFWEYDDDKLIDGYGDFRDDGSPECWILEMN